MGLSQLRAEVFEVSGRGLDSGAGPAFTFSQPINLLPEVPFT